MVNARKTLFATAALAALVVASPALAGGNNNGPVCVGRDACETNNNTDNRTYNRGGHGGIGVGIGHGGDANASAGAVSIAEQLNRQVLRNRNTNTNVNHNANVGINAQRQGQGQEQGQGQAQSLSSQIGATGSGNSTSVEGDTYEAPDIPVASAIAPDTGTTATCVVGISGGVQTMGFGVSLGSGITDEVCQMLEIARVGASMTDAEVQAVAKAVYLQAASQYIDLRTGGGAAADEPQVSDAIAAWQER